MNLISGLSFNAQDSKLTFGSIIGIFTLQVLFITQVKVEIFSILFCKFSALCSALSCCISIRLFIHKVNAIFN